MLTTAGLVAGTTGLPFTTATACGCGGGGGGEEGSGETEAGEEFPTSMSISPSPYKFLKVESQAFTITDTSLFTFFEIENITSTNSKFKPSRACVGHTLFAFLGPKSCVEHVEFVTPFEAGKSAVLEVSTLGGNEIDNLSS
jgi:hypothetical protein